MSRSNNVDVKNPAVKFFQWSGDEGTINFYDKEAKEKVNVPTPFTFLVLDKLITITGYSDDDKSGYWSNEILNTKTDTLTVRTKSGIKAIGYYDEVKTLVGAKFAQSVYIAFYDDNKQLRIGNFKLNGCAVSAWIEFCKGKNIYQNAITIVGRGEEQTKGKTKYYAPVFATKEVSEATNDKSKELDLELQEYLKAYFAMRGQQNEKAESAVAGSDYIAERNAEISAFEEPVGNVPEWAKPMSDESIPFGLLFCLVSLGLMLVAYGQMTMF